MKIRNQHATQANTPRWSGKNSRHLQSASRRKAGQSGVVLFMALIALVAMTIAAIALVRSVDTANLVAGNVAMKQGAIQEADAGMNAAFTCIAKQGSLLIVKKRVEADFAGCNYFAKMQPLSATKSGIPDRLITESGLTALDSLTPPIPNYSPNPVTRNTTMFMIERLCTTNGVWSDANCLDSPWGKKSGDGWHDIRQGQGTGGELGGQVNGPQALYRISVKVTGPRNLVAYSQLIVNSER